MTVQPSDVECQECGALLHLAPDQRTTNCLFCRSANVVERSGKSGRPQPAFALGFVVPYEGAQTMLERWQEGLGFFKEPLVKQACVEHVAGVYLPAFLYSATAYSQYGASVAIVWTTGSGNNKSTHTEWYPLQGQHAAYVRDVLVTASRGVANWELERVEPYDLRALHRYTPALISGWPCEDPSLSPDQVWGQARQEGLAHVGGMLHQFMPGRRHRDLRHQSRLEYETLDYVLVPLWVLALRYDPAKPLVRVLVNGQTGRLWGDAPRSNKRVAMAVIVLLLVVVLPVLAIVVAGALI